MACTEQTEDTPRGNKVNSPLKKSSTSEQAPQTLSLPRSDHAAERLICCCHHGKCKAQQQSITLLLYYSSCSLHFFAETANKRADKWWLCHCHYAQKQGGQRWPEKQSPRMSLQRGAAASPGHKVGTRTQGCALFWHMGACDGAERAAPSRHLRDR